jgi:hypothetical protein
MLYGEATHLLSLLQTQQQQKKPGRLNDTFASGLFALILPYSLPLPFCVLCYTFCRAELGLPGSESGRPVEASKQLAAQLDSWPPTVRLLKACFLAAATVLCFCARISYHQTLKGECRFLTCESGRHHIHANGFLLYSVYSFCFSALQVSRRHCVHILFASGVYLLGVPFGLALASSGMNRVGSSLDFYVIFLPPVLYYPFHNPPYYILV